MQRFQKLTKHQATKTASQGPTVSCPVGKHGKLCLGICFFCLGSDLLLLLSENIQALEQYREFYRVR